MDANLILQVNYNVQKGELSPPGTARHAKTAVAVADAAAPLPDHGSAEGGTAEPRIKEPRAAAQSRTILITIF